MDRDSSSDGDETSKERNHSISDQFPDISLAIHLPHRYLGFPKVFESFSFSILPHDLMNSARLLSIFFGVLSLCVLPSCVTSPGGSDLGGGSSAIGDTARYLAGLSGSNRSDLALPRSSAEWKAHADQMNSLWARQSGRQSHIGKFRKELIGLTSPRVLFYPFGGPDYLHASSYFPGASTYVLVGLEGVDSMPESSSLSADDLSRGLRGLSYAVRNQIEAGYFVTTEMRSDLAGGSLRGTLPLLLSQIARDGKTVHSIEAVSLDGAGNLTGRGGACPGWHIRAGGKDIFYFRQDLSNGGLGDRRLLKFVDHYGAPVTFVKSASYLMHQGNFSVIRDYITNSSRGLVQGPSGVPYRNLRDAGWNLRLHGNYRGAGSPFTQYTQSDLVAAYANHTHPVKPMSFGFGYLYNPSETCVIVGRR